jgi:iron complex outermembrane receptor protein
MKTTDHRTVNRKNPIALLSAWLVLALAPTVSAPAAEGGASTGTIEGRVLNATNGQYLKNARVTVQGTNLEAMTNEFGEYRLSQVPSGTASVKAAYVGLDAATQSVVVSPGQSVTQDFSVGDVVKLDSFVVSSSRETNASNIAINEQRHAGNIKNVVTSDAFGDSAEGNVGELMKFLPGVTMEYVAADTRSIMVRGFGSEFTSVNVDGARMAGASSGGQSRVFELETVSINNVSRVEVSKVPTPSESANSLGGTVNLVSRSAFESSHAQLRYRASLNMGSNETEIFKKTPGPRDYPSYKVLPGFDFNYILPLTKDFGLVINGLNSNQVNSEYEAASNWIFTGAVATAAAPYLRNYNVSVSPKITQRSSLAVQADWRPAKNHVVSVGGQANYYHAFFDGIYDDFAVGGTPLSYGPNFTSGADGGAVSQSRYAYDKIGATVGANLAHRYTGRAWEIDSGFSASSSRSWYRDTGHGHFFDVQTRLQGVARVRFDDVVDSIPGKISTVDATGKEIDWVDLNNYRLAVANSGQRESFDHSWSGRLNVKRALDFLPFLATVKVGGLVDQQDRDLLIHRSSMTFVGRDGIANTADDSARPYIDPQSIGKAGAFRSLPNMQYPNIYRLWQEFLAHPEYFTKTLAQRVSDRTTEIANSNALSEKVTAGYIQGEARIWQNRLRILTGVRWEKTDDHGFGPVVDPGAPFQRGANGKFLLDSAGARIRKPEAGAAGSFEELTLMRKERGAEGSRTYDGYYPSLHLTYNATENFIVRAAYAETLGRPNLSNIIPGITLNENTNPNPPPGASPGTISVVNSGLLPYKAKSYDLSMEYYFPNGGLVSVGGFRKDLTNFFGASSVLATSEMLTELDLDDRYVGWNVSTRFNVTDVARVTGAEFNYNQPLTFLPGWGKYFKFNGNITALHLQGPRNTDFSGFLPKAANVGLTFTKKSFVLMLKENYRGRQRRGSSGVSPNAFNYYQPRATLDISAEVNVIKHVTAFVNVRNVTNVIFIRETYSPATPSYSARQMQSNFGAQWIFGIKGNF